MHPNEMNEIYIWAVVTEQIRIDTVKVHDYLKITATHMVSTAVIQYLNKFKHKGTNMKMWN